MLSFVSKPDLKHKKQNENESNSGKIKMVFIRLGHM